MSKTEHTPGPWHIEFDGDTSIQVMSDDYGRIVTLHAAHGVQAQIERLEPDANLIAAAPDLLAACRTALLASMDNSLDQDDVAQLRTAIAKAEGRD